MKMKLLSRSLSLLSIASLTLLFANCGGGGGETAPEKIAVASLTGNTTKTWTLVSAEFDNTDDRTDEFDNFELTLSGTYTGPDDEYDYSVTGSQPDLSPWPQGVAGTDGTWSFGGTPDKTSGLISRDDGIGMFYSIDSNGRLTLIFTVPDGSGYPARTSQVEGDWEFVFDPA
jgi:hypothetical protein